MEPVSAAVSEAESVIRIRVQRSLYIVEKLAEGNSGCHSATCSPKNSVLPRLGLDGTEDMGREGRSTPDLELTRCSFERIITVDGSLRRNRRIATAGKARQTGKRGPCWPEADRGSRYLDRISQACASVVGVSCWELCRSSCEGRKRDLRRDTPVSHAGRVTVKCSQSYTAPKRLHVRSRTALQSRTLPKCTQTDANVGQLRRPQRRRKPRSRTARRLTRRSAPAAATADPSTPDPCSYNAEMPLKLRAVHMHTAASRRLRPARKRRR